MNKLESALTAAAMGWRVFPRFLRAWPERATTNKSIVRRWWKERPAADIAIATGSASNGLVVLHLSGDNGESALAEVEGYGRLPRTVTVGWPGGRDLYFSSPESLPTTRGVFGEGLDVEAERGQIVAVGSGDDTQGHWRYAIAPLDGAAVAPLPRWFRPVLLMARYDRSRQAGERKRREVAQRAVS